MRPHFDGETYEPGRDHARLTRQLDMVRDIMEDRDWYTLRELSVGTGQPEASVSARIRDLRKPKFGGHDVERQYVGKGLWKYRMHK